MVQKEAGGAGLGPVLAVVGGALAGVGSFLAWARVSAQGLDVSAKGTDGSDGWITLVAAVVLIACGLLAFRGAGRRAVAVLAILAGLVAGGVALYDALTAKDTIIDKTAEQVAGPLGVSKADAVTLINQAIDAGQIDLSLAFGIYLVIGGGAVGLVGGALMLGGKTTTTAIPAADMPAATTPAAADWSTPVAEPSASAWPSSPAPPAPPMPEAAPGSSDPPDPSGE